VLRITVSNLVISLVSRAEMHGVLRGGFADIFPRHVRIISTAGAGAYAFCRAVFLDIPGVAALLMSKRPSRLIPVYPDQVRQRGAVLVRPQSLMSKYKE